MKYEHRETTGLKSTNKRFRSANRSLICQPAKTTEAQVLGKQVLRSGTSVGARYREGQRAKADSDFINKMEGGLQELDETAYWLELLADSGIVPPQKLAPLQKEADELTAIFVTIVTKVKKRTNKN